MTPARQRKKQFFAEVNARGGRERWNRFAMWIGRLLRIAFVLALCSNALALTGGTNISCVGGTCSISGQVGVAKDGCALRHGSQGHGKPEREPQGRREDLHVGAW